MKHVLLMACAAFVLTSCTQQSEKQASASTEITPAEQIKRGEYLVTIGGCNDCHSPKKMTDQGPVPDQALLLSGHPSSIPVSSFDSTTASNWILFHPMGTASKGPWGISYAANLTPDATGIGNWSEEQFFNAMRKGWYKGMEGTRPLMPLMPWQNYQNMSEEDLRAIFAYLKSLPPVKNVVPAYTPPTM